MSSKSKKGSNIQLPKLRSRRTFLSVIKVIVSTWRGYIELQSWALVAYAIIIVVTKNLFTIAGLALVGGIALTIILYYLDKSLKRY
jgi:hypothetical protein